MNTLQMQKLGDQVVEAGKLLSLSEGTLLSRIGPQLKRIAEGFSRMDKSAMQRAIDTISESSRTYSAIMSQKSNLINPANSQPKA